MTALARVAITGIGLVTPIGREPGEIVEALRRGKSGIRPPANVDVSRLLTRWLGECDDVDAFPFLSERESRKHDRGTRMAIAASAAALASAGIDPSGDGARTAVCLGTSGSGQFQNMPVAIDYAVVVNRKAALVHARNVPHFQAAAVARAFGLRGPNVTFSSASTSSAAALGEAMALVRARRVDRVLAGGAEAISLVNLLGLEGLGMSAGEPCTPFRGGGGLTFGDGAAVFVLEPLEAALARSAHVFAELLGFAATSDGQDTLAADPSGRGLSRALRAALDDAGLSAADVTWVKASGTGHRGQDLTEAAALGQVFGSRRPPVTSLETYVGHCNGAAPAVGLALALLAREAGIVPATLGRGELRPGCDLDLVTQTREARAPVLAASSMGFGGSNAVVVAGDPRPVPPRRLDDDPVVTGLGIVSPLGTGVDRFASALAEGRCGVKASPWVRDGAVPDGVACVDAAELRPWLRDAPRRLDRLRCFALAAARMALHDAGLGLAAGEGMGMIVAVSHGAVQAQEAFYDRLCRERPSAVTGRMLVGMARLGLAGDLGAALRVQGPATTISGGISCGLQALAVARDLLTVNRVPDAFLIIAADELGELFLRMYGLTGVLADGRREGRFAPYDGKSSGTILGEGAVALVIERAGVARRRGAAAWARVAGAASRCDAQGFMHLDPSGRALAFAIADALGQADTAPREVDLAIGHGRGLPQADAAELAGIVAALGREVPLTCVTGATGVGEASCGLMSAAAALVSMERGIAFPIHTGGTLPADAPFVTGGTRPGHYRRTLLAGSTDHGSHTAVILAADGRTS